MAEPAPLAADRFRLAFGRAVDPLAGGIVLAVSGGPDSMALLHLVGRLAKSHALPPVTVGTVDHGLRPGSAADAAAVEHAAGRIGLPCRRLAWTGPKPKTGVQAKAREARYRLLRSLCADVGADHIVTAHTRDDQAETVLLRLLRGSGLAGLGAMAPRATREGITLARPLLDVSKACLVATCQAFGVEVRRDPSNEDDRFTRARLRRIMPLLAGEGFGPENLARLADRLARADQALRHTATATADACRLPASDGVARWDGRRLAAAPGEIAIRVLAAAVVEAGGDARRLDRLEHMVKRLAGSVARRRALRATLGGALLTLAPDGTLVVAPEAARRRGRPRPSAAVNPVGSFTWQG